MTRRKHRTTCRAATRSATILAAAAMAFSATAAAAAGDAPSAPGERVDRAIAAARKYLLARIGEDGRCEGEYPAANPRFGGRTALCAWALLTAGVRPRQSEPLARAMAWLDGAKLHGTYAVALRACAGSLLPGARTRGRLRKDVEWLIEAANASGGYTYTSSGGMASETQDNSNAQLALLGIWAGARRGVEVPLTYWRRAERYWLDQQQYDGGWGYRIDPATMRTKPYGSMTAAGLASLYVCFDNLHAEQFIRCLAPGENEPIAKALDWLGKRFRADENPGKGVEWQYYWLFAVARVGLASGHKYLGESDWYAAGRDALTATQHAGGSWGYADPVSSTAFAMMFLARGRHPVLLNKLRYTGRWNPRPRDAANYARWVTTTFEKPVSWQIVGADSPLADWHDAPILYLSGAGPVELTAEQIGKIRTFVLQGGSILSEAACNSGDFSLDMDKLYRKLFPEYPLIRLPAGHAVYSAHVEADAGKWLLGVSNGVRLLAVHAPRELSLAMQLGPRQTHLPTWRLLGNLYIHATDRGQLRRRGTPAWPTPRAFTPRATVRVARLKHAGNCDPEPLAWERFAIRLGLTQRVRLDVSGPIDITKLDPDTCRIAHMTGTDPFTLTGDETAALKRFLAAGGTLFVDAAGGSPIFSRSVQRQLYPLLDDATTGELALDHPLYVNRPHDMRTVRYRRDYALTLGRNNRTRPHLRVVLDGERLAIIHSPEDITFGLLGTPAFGVVGYTPDSAERLATNILYHAAGLGSR